MNSHPDPRIRSTDQHSRAREHHGSGQALKEQGGYVCDGMRQSPNRLLGARKPASAASEGVVEARQMQWPG